MKMSMEPAFDQMTNIINRNAVEIEIAFKSEIAMFEEMFNITYLIANKHAAFFNNGFAERGEGFGLLWTAFGKSMNSMYSIYDLTRKGQIGSARMLMRNVFEFLFIAKYASISNDLNFIDRWENGEQIATGKIFSKITSPDTTTIRRVWKLLCQYVHGTIFSQQSSLDWQQNKKNIKLNLIILRMLMEMNYHLLNSHILNRSVKSYVELYDHEEEIKYFKKRLKDIFKLSKRFMGEDPRKVIYHFKLSWDLDASRSVT